MEYMVNGIYIHTQIPKNIKIRHSKKILYKNIHSSIIDSSQKCRNNPKVH